MIYASHSDTIDASAVRLAHIIRAYSLGNDTVPAEAESGWYNYEFAIPMSGTVRILIEGISEYGNSTYMDNFKVYRMPSCRQVKGVAASEIGADSAVISFKKTAAPQYQVVATIAAINPDTLDKVADTLIVFNQTVSEDTLVISALQPQTDYYVYVRGLCDDEDFGAWSAALKMKTACGAITAFPWNEDFESYATGSTSSPFAAPCWSNTLLTGSAAPLYVSSGTGTNTSKILYQGYYSGSGTSTTLLSTPAFQIDEVNAYVFALDVHRNNTGYESEGVRIYVSASEEIDASAQELAFIPRAYNLSEGSIAAESAEGWYTYEFTIPMSGTIHILVRTEQENYGWYTRLDLRRLRLLLQRQLGSRPMQLSIRLFWQMLRLHRLM